MNVFASISTQTCLLELCSITLLSSNSSSKLTQLLMNSSLKQALFQIDHWVYWLVYDTNENNTASYTFSCFKIITLSIIPNQN